MKPGASRPSTRRTGTSAGTSASFTMARMRPSVDDHRLAVAELRAIEDPGAGEGERVIRVFVTLLRCGGRSGSRPRARATASASG